MQADGFKVAGADSVRHSNLDQALRQNRVTPLSELIADPARGLVYGNRGCLHDDAVGSGGATTAGGGSRADSSSVAGSAGRCCSRERSPSCSSSTRRRRSPPATDRARFAAVTDYSRFVARWQTLHPGQVGADAIDAQLHDERLDSDTRAQRHHDAALDDLPDGAFVLHEGAPQLVLGDSLLSWSPAGYRRSPTAADTTAGARDHASIPRRRVAAGLAIARAGRAPLGDYARVMEELELLDWKRRVFALYAEVRADAAAASAPGGAGATCATSSSASHPQSPLPPSAQPRGPTSTTTRRCACSPTVEPAERERARSRRRGEQPYSFTRFARARFELGGEQQRSSSTGSTATAAACSCRSRDATSGSETYGAGRYLLDTVKGADLGEDDGRLVLDFNFAYNPSCAYDPRWVCPLAPPGEPARRSRWRRRASTQSLARRAHVRPEPSVRRVRCRRRAMYLAFERQARSTPAG